MISFWNPLAACLFVCAAFAQDIGVYKQGHSHMGTAFDEGPRQKPWVMEGIGQVHFPITTKNPEVQKWFNQGIALLHSFWYYEAERSFRWCLKLEPESAMAYWGLALSAMNAERASDFVAEAVKRKATVTERERLYIEWLAAGRMPDPFQDKPEDNERGDENARKVLETLCIKFPDDLEAKAFLALSSMGSNRYGAELMIREVLAKQPDHPGAHHYRIHNWDYHEPEQALYSAGRYGKIVPGIGHALHMPGHIYSIVGMWNEAAIAMDAATRAEKQYMRDSLTFPFNNWNYAHNRYYLSYIQEQLGMPSAAIFGARQLIDAPKDPKDNTDNWRSSRSFGLAALARALLRFDRFEELADGKTVPWREKVFYDKMSKAYFEARAHFATGKSDQAVKSIAAHTALKTELEKNKDVEQVWQIQTQELKARLALSRGDTLKGLALMSEAAEREFKLQLRYADPPSYPEALYNSLGEMYLDAKSAALAVKAFEKGLELTKMDLFALSGLVRAHHSLGHGDEAKKYADMLAYAALGAEPNLRPVRLAAETGIKGDPRDGAPEKQRDYSKMPLDQYGPSVWEPYPAPTLDVRDASGKPVNLANFSGKNVVLVFYLGQECPHCMLQLHKLGKMADDWKKLDTVLLAVSSQAPEKNKETLKALGALPWQLLSDGDHAVARRWHSYDDFEEMELHSTVLIDKKGRVYWGRFGGDPFSDTEFLTSQLEQMNALAQR